MSDSASRTSSSLNGLITASTFFIATPQRSASVASYITLRGHTLPLGPLRSDRITPVLAEAARRDADAHRGLSPLVFGDLDQSHHLRHVLRREASRHDLGRAHAFLHVCFEDRIQHV